MKKKAVEPDWGSRIEKLKARVKKLESHNIPSEQLDEALGALMRTHLRISELELWKNSVQAQMTVPDLKAAILAEVKIKAQELVRAINFAPLVAGLVAQAVSDALAGLDFGDKTLPEFVREELQRAAERSKPQETR